MKASKSSALLSLLVLTVLASCAQMSPQPRVASGDHNALVRHYENVASDTKARLQENKKALKAYEAHPYYYGRQGQEFRSHTAANIREYEKTLRESLSNADLHRRMAMEQANSINKAKNNLDRDATAVN